MTDGLKDLSMRQPSPWIPMTDPVELAMLGKAVEEVNELGSAIARCIIQGIDEAHPTTGKTNRQWLTEEMADVRAVLATLQKQFGITDYDMEERVEVKLKHFSGWRKLIRERITLQFRMERDE